MKNSRILYCSMMCFFITQAFSLVYASSPTTPEDILKEYGWTAGEYKEFQVVLPKKFTHLPGEYPHAIYWAYNNELSKKIGLDMRKYRGKEITLRMYEVEEKLPLECAPFTKGKGMIAIYEERVIGAWVSGVSTACSLDRKYINAENIAGMSWSRWLIKRKVVRKKNKQDKSFKDVSPEQIIRKVCEHMSKQDFTSAHACFTRRYLLNMFFYTLSQYESFDTKFSHTFLGGVNTIESVQVIKIKQLVAATDDVAAYTVYTNVRYRNADPVSRSWIFILKKEIEFFGWRIADIRRR